MLNELELLFDCTPHKLWLGQTERQGHLRSDWTTRRASRQAAISVQAQLSLSLSLSHSRPAVHWVSQLIVARLWCDSFCERRSRILKRLNVL